MHIADPDAYFQHGFPLESPPATLAWNMPLQQVAQASGGVWESDRFWWHGARYLGGLSYPLFSRNTDAPHDPFRAIFIAVGMGDHAALIGYAHVAKHLAELFGPAHEIGTGDEVPEAPTLSWNFASAEVTLSVIEQHSYRCYLTVYAK